MGLANILSTNANFDGMKSLVSGFPASSSGLPILRLTEFIHKVSINMTETTTVEVEKNKEDCIDGL